MDIQWEISLLSFSNWFLAFPGLSHISFVPIRLQAYHRPNRLWFVYIHFTSCDQSLDKASVEFRYMLRAMQSCAMNTKSSITLKLPKSMVT